MFGRTQHAFLTRARGLLGTSLVGGVSQNSMLAAAVIACTGAALSNGVSVDLLNKVRGGAPLAKDKVEDALNLLRNLDVLESPICDINENIEGRLRTSPLSSRNPVEAKRLSSDSI